MENTLTRRQERGVVALLTSNTVVKACAASGIPRATMGRWLRDERFTQELARRGAEIYAESHRRLLREQEASVEALSLLRDGADSDAVRLQAAKALLELCTKYREKVDHEVRLAALERGRQERS